jgi:transcriptional regulator of acetoin/glycerol metabolism
VGDIAIADLPENFRQRLQQVAALPETERRRLLDALLTAKWNKSRAASILHCSRMTLYRKMAKYSVVASDDARITVSHRGVTPRRRKTSA